MTIDAPIGAGYFQSNAIGRVVPIPPVAGGSGGAFGVTGSDINTVSFVDGLWANDFSLASTGVKNTGWSNFGLSINDNYDSHNNGTGEFTRIRGGQTKANGSSGNVGTVYYGQGHNYMSSPFELHFNTPQKEFWYRKYYQIANGQTLGGLFEHKIIYLFTDDGVAANVNWPGQSDQIVLQPRLTPGGDVAYGTGHGWAELYGSTAAAADGSWHCFEFQFDLGTAPGNGVFRMWVDGILEAESTNLDWFNGGASSPTGWSYIQSPLNHNEFAGFDLGHNLDELAIAIPGWSGFRDDGNGNNFIGTLV